jgi:hypothetical protein
LIAFVVDVGRGGHFDVRMATNLERILTERELAATFNSTAQRHQLLMECLLN